MTMNQKRVTVLVIAGVLAGYFLFNLIMAAVSGWHWYNAIDIVMLLINACMVAQLVWLFVQQYKRRRYTEWRRRIESINPTFNQL